MTVAPFTEHLLQIFIIIAGVLLIPVALAAMVVLFKLSFLVHSASELLAVASYELVPVMKDLRTIADKLQSMGDKAASSVKDFKNSFQGGDPRLKQGVGYIGSGVKALFRGIGRAFQR